MNTLFSLPIYSCAKDKFEEKYEKYILARAKHSHYYPFDVERAKKNIRKFEWKKGIWKYNQIIGYLEVFVQGGSLAFRAYLPEEKNVMKFSSVKKYLYRVDLYGLYIQLIGSNERIANKLIDMIQSIQKAHKWHIDYSFFNQIYRRVDYTNLKSVEDED